MMTAGCFGSTFLSSPTAQRLTGRRLRIVPLAATITDIFARAGPRLARLLIAEMRKMRVAVEIVVSKQCFGQRILVRDLLGGRVAAEVARPVDIDFGLAGKNSGV